MLKEFVALGLYSDTAVNGVDASIFKTDGLDILGEVVSITRPYSMELKTKILKALKIESMLDVSFLKEVDEEVTQHHIFAARDLLEKVKKIYPTVDVIGFPGHSLLHKVDDRLSIQLGNADEMAGVFNCPVVNRFAQADLKAGGTGSPVFPSFFEALTRSLEKPLALVTIGGISSLTWIGPVGELMAFDVGAGNIILDTWMRMRLGAEMDFDGIWAAKGHVEEKLLAHLMQHPFLKQNPPKTLDRNDFNPLLRQVEGLSIADGAATLTAFVAESIAQAARFLPQKPVQWILTGGGTFNPSLVRMTKERIPQQVIIASELGWDKDSWEAQAYGFLAARSLNGLPLTFPGTTGVQEPLCGGMIHYPSTEA